MLIGSSVGAAGSAGRTGVRRLLALRHLERVAAAARSDGVRVLDLEPGLLDRLEVVDLRAHQVRSAEGIDHDLDALAVALVVAAGEAEAILEARAAAALDRDPQDRDVLFGRHELLDLGRSRFGERNDRV